ncbi:unnamed protein product (macronuclear) [Paramecium tetraurelia]|uniref:Uncharacterized protein n=1 Tax=Paramecium tetraurelia TaxID=5888 RepID=A0DSM6_PARTE|nr:uncharacterized protein GSPATT00019736001 [Paramecium tetraurelia]CAK86043.1 unnamed protein product [Paramecium tetraurelia]|eukprot:XP_001453440.1 hypothetical protein (macronuclear) [Paramecium tetraurelia strain d4-2]
MLLTKHKLSLLIKAFNLKLNSDQIWKEFQRKGLLIQINHNNDLAVIQLDQLQNNSLSINHRTILETCFKGWEIFLLFKAFLINENISFTFGSYLKRKLEIEGKELQKNENLLAINNLKRYLGLQISNKLLTLMQQNDEKLEEVIKIYRNLKQDKQYDDSLIIKVSHQQITKIIQKLEQYFENIQDIIKIMRLNQNKQKEIGQITNFQKLNDLLRLQVDLELYLILFDRNQTQNIKGKVANNELFDLITLITDELKNKDFQEYNFSSFDLSAIQQNRNKILKEVEKLVGIYEMEIYKLITNQLLQSSQNLVNYLQSEYESRCDELQKQFSKLNFHLQGIMVIKYQMKTVTQICQLEKIKQVFIDMHLLKFLEDLRYENLKLKLKLVALKRAFSFILQKAEPEELRKLSEVINVGGFLLNIIQEFQKGIQTTNFEAQLQIELKNIEIIKKEDFEDRLSKQQGIVKYLIFKQSINEKLIEQDEIDLELIKKEFGQLQIEETPSSTFEKLKQIFQNLNVDESLQRVMDEKLNSSQLKLEQEKYGIFLSQLKQIGDFRKQIQIKNWNQLIQQTETVIRTLENFGCPDKETIKMLINEELILLKSIIIQQIINNEELQVSTSQKDNKRVDTEGNEKCHQVEKVQQIDLQVKKSENANQTFNFYSNESYRTYLSFILKVVKLKKLILKQQMALLHNLLEEVNFFSNTINQIEKFNKEIQTKFQQRFQFCIQEYIQKFEQLQFSQINLSQKKDENFHLYLESLEAKLFKRINDEEIIQININIFDFLNCLEVYLRNKLVQKSTFSINQVEEDCLYQLIKKIYLHQDSEKVDDVEESKEKFGFLDNLVQRFKDFTNNEQWKIKQGLVFTIIQISSNCFSDSITSFCQKVLIQLWVQEKDLRVRNILKNKDLISMQMQILQKDWQSQHNRIAGKMQEMLRRIDELQEQISHEANLNKRDIQLKELDETTEQLDQQIENISEMGQQLRLV